MQRIENADTMVPRTASAWDALPFALPYLVLAILVNASIQGGLHIFIPFFFAVALGDLLFGLRTTNLDPNSPPAALRLHHLLLWLWCPAQIGVLVFVLWQVLATGHLSTLEIVALTYIIGKSCVSGTSVGHELVHRPKKWERLLGEILLSSFAFSHYRTEHVYVHHAHVGTPNDPVFARKGQSAWAYMPRAVFGNIVRSWQFERDKLRRRGVPTWHYTNPFWRYGALTAVWLILVWSLGEAGPLGGWIGIAIYLVYSAIAMMILRLVDYVEHYGLSRKILPKGRFERVQPRHSWNASQRISNWAVWNVQRHSDHHHRPIRAYPLLQHYGTDVAPQLPTNYTGMILVAMVPPLWFRLIDPRVDAWRAQFYPEIENWRAYESELYLSRPDKLPLIGEVMETAPRLGDWVEAQPDLLDSLDRPEFENLTIPDDIGLAAEELALARRGLVTLYYQREIDYGDLQTLTIDSEEPQHILDVVDTARDWMNTHAFQAAVHTMRGNLEPRLLVATLSKLVDAGVEVLLQSNSSKFADDPSSLEGIRYAVVAFGKHGDRELSLDSTLDVALIHDAPDPNAEQAVQELAQRLFRSLDLLARQNVIIDGVESAPGDAGKTRALALGDLESQLGGDGVAASLALAQARVVCGDGELAKEFENARRQLLSAQASLPDLQERLAQLRSRLAEPEPASGFAYFHALGKAPGGFADLRLMAASAAMLDARDGVATEDAGNGADAFAAAASRGALDAEAASELGDAFSLWQSLAAILPFTQSRRRSGDTRSTAEEAFAATACGADSLALLAEVAEESRSKASARIDELLGGT